VSQVGLKNNYTFCGEFRRQALDRGAMQLGVNKIVTGHNADDIAETVIMNIAKQTLYSHSLYFHLLKLFGERVHAAVVDGDWSPGLAADARLWHESWGLRVGDGGGHQLAACELVLVQHVEGREEDEGGEHATDLLQGVGDVRVGADEDRLADLAGDVPSDGEQLHPGYGGAPPSHQFWVRGLRVSESDVIPRYTIRIKGTGQSRKKSKISEFGWSKDSASSSFSPINNFLI